MEKTAQIFVRLADFARCS